MYQTVKSSFIIWNKKEKLKLHDNSYLHYSVNVTVIKKTTKNYKLNTQ